MKIISKSRVEFIPEFRAIFQSTEEPFERGLGWSFDCDAEGNVRTATMQPAGLENYRKCLSGENPCYFDGVVDYSRYYRHPAIGRCYCGEAVELARFTNTCERCGADYNMDGQRLADRSQWGEETGESLADIMSTYDPEEVPYYR